jgi:hypothetical protein
MSRRSASTVAVAGLLLVLVAMFLDSGVASGQPDRPHPSAAPGTFQPPGFGHPAKAPDPGKGGPAPYVQAFGAQSASPLPLPKSSTKQSVPNADGCDHNYGTANQCVPWTFPAGVTDKCAWLHAHNLSSIQVRGRDRQGLDTNHDRVACGRGDH